MRADWSQQYVNVAHHDSYEDYQSPLTAAFLKIRNDLEKIKKDDERFLQASNKAV